PTDPQGPSSAWKLGADRQFEPGQEFGATPQAIGNADGFYRATSPFQCVIAGGMPMRTTTAELAAVCKRFAHFDKVTVDTEFMRETTYWPKLCVIQMASPEEAVIVDAMAPDIDLDPF